MNPYWIDAFGALQTRDRKRFPVVHSFLPESSTQERIIPASVILHSNAAPHRTKWRDLFRYLLRLDVTIECHFQLRGDGALVQMIPVFVRADCNYKANAWWSGGRRYGAISFESQDKGAGTLAHTPWSKAAHRTLTHVLAALAMDERTIIETKACAGPFDNGIGYHSQFAEWSVYVGKTCPGAARINQVPGIIAMAAEIEAQG